MKIINPILFKLIMFIGLISFFPKSFSEIYLDFTNYRIGSSASIKIVGGGVSGIDFNNQLSISNNPFGGGQIVTNIYDSTGLNGSTIQYFGNKEMESCPNGWNPSGELSQVDFDVFAEWVNQYISRQPILYFMRGVTPSYKYYQYPGVRWMRFNCHLPTGKWIGGTIKTEGAQIVVPPPQENISVCSINSQNLNFVFSSSNLNVDGLSKTSKLIVSCTNGNAMDYQLKLSGNNVTNGMLDFRNGVKAKIFLNGTQIHADGSGILLNQLTSQTISINAILIGSAIESGLTHTNGILILEAL